MAASKPENPEPIITVSTYRASVCVLSTCADSVVGNGADALLVTLGWTFIRCFILEVVTTDPRIPAQDNKHGEAWAIAVAVKWKWGKFFRALRNRYCRSIFSALKKIGGETDRVSPEYAPKRM
ncbi:phosphoserine aminotransferase [Mariprofundus ferrooxydans]|uniref:Phosphoserine aminotransferase n=1 Tax=Mariprofundus ferrooxydans PV-1 TaxID=314345 RepID=Q0F209_9PROT|nr:phosphoserine aminotransferase [Mariprofundus ferrooxydans PV-1]KON47899.1 phosphoserine aminotransferase [Mariprofundus ferrooxydans]